MLTDSARGNPPIRTYIMDARRSFDPQPVKIEYSDGSFICCRCRREFPCKILTIFGIPTKPNLCDDCEPEISRETKSVRSYVNPENIRKDQWDAFCPEAFRDPKNSFSMEKLPQPAKYHAAMDWTYSPRGLLLHGPTHQGKTRIAYQLLARLHFDEKVKIDGGDSARWVNECSKRFRDGDGERWIEKQQKVALLFLDDLGNESSGERGEGSVFAVIKYRCEHQLPTIITTNKIAANFEDQARNKDRGAALGSRLIDFFDAIGF